MEQFNDENSSIYQETLSQQREYITTKLDNIRSNRYMDDTCLLSGEIEDIVNHLNKGLAQNLVLDFFKKPLIKSSCIHCGGSRGENGIRDLQRAHCNLFSRGDILMMAVEKLYVDENTPIPSGKILKEFISQHVICPIYTLCNICHNKYDNQSNSNS